MNLILLHDQDFVSATRVILKDRRAEHVRRVHRAGVGDSLRVGLIDSLMGTAQILSLDDNSLELEVNLTQEPPPPLDLTLLLALPRPKMLKRILQTVSAMGAKRIYLINSYRVEKSFWSSPLLTPEALAEHLHLGLEQARDTMMPQIHLRPRFKPFVEDELPQLSRATKAFVAHPQAAEPCPLSFTDPVTLAIGPEGGFIPYEIEKLEECGFRRITLGQRILRVETAVPTLLARFPLL